MVSQRIQWLPVWCPGDVAAQTETSILDQDSIPVDMRMVQVLARQLTSTGPHLERRPDAHVPQLSRLASDAATKHLASLLNRCKDSATVFMQPYE